MMRKRAGANETRYTLDEAKAKWPSCADKLDDAMGKISARRKS